MCGARADGPPVRVLERLVEHVEARELVGDDEIVAHALNNVGSAWYNRDNGRANEVWQTAYHDQYNSFVRDRYPMAYLEMNPEDARTLGVAAGGIDFGGAIVRDRMHYFLAYETLDEHAVQTVAPGTVPSGVTIPVDLGQFAEWARDRKRFVMDSQYLTGDSLNAGKCLSSITWVFVLPAACLHARLQR